MGRPLRRQAPGQVYLVTTRCHQARFFLRPDPPLNQAVLEWLARAQKRFPQIRILAVCGMSNHLHLVVHDQAGQLADWASYLLGNLARAVNRIRGRSGACFQRRYAAEPILDAEALIDRLVYVVTNPVKAGLCQRASQWPGVLLYARDQRQEEIPVSGIDSNAQARGPRPGGANREAFRVEGSLVIDPLPEMDGLSQSTLSVSIRAREEALARERRAAGLRTLRPSQVLAQSWHAAPRQPKRSPRALCHAASKELRAAFRRGFQAFVSFFREASQLLRLGATRVAFPDWSFPPGRPLMRPALAGGGALQH